MSTRTTTKKRKSIDNETTAAKKPKVAKSTKPLAPLKSALKKSRSDPPAGELSVSKSKAASTKSKPSKVAHPKSTENSAASVEIDNDAAPDLTEDQTAALLAGFSSSDEDDDKDEGGVVVDTLKPVRLSGSVQKSLQQAKALEDDPETTPGVIYIGRIPHGFYEQQMRAYLSQFGQVKRLRLARNKKTGNSRHFGFVEFVSAAVADIVVKTMDKYLLFNHILQVRRVPTDQIKEKMFVGAKKHPVPRNRMEREYLNDGVVREDWEKRVLRENTRRKKNAEKLKELGYEFAMPIVKSVDTVALKPTTIEDGATDQAGAAVDAEVGEDTLVTERAIEVEPKAIQITETTVAKKRNAEGKPKSKKVIKKAKVDA